MQGILLALLVAGYFLISIYDHFHASKRIKTLEREILIIMGAVYRLEKANLLSERCNVLGEINPNAQENKE